MIAALVGLLLGGVCNGFGAWLYVHDLERTRGESIRWRGPALCGLGVGIGAIGYIIGYILERGHLR